MPYFKYFLDGEIILDLVPSFESVNIMLCEKSGDD